MTATTTINPGNLLHGIGIVQVARALANKGRTLETLRERPGIRFTNKELERIQTIGGRPFNAKLVTNDFANQTVQLALGGNKLAVMLFRTQQLKISGLPATIHGNKPAVIDLEPLKLYYHASDNKVLEAKVIKYDEHTWVTPEKLKSGVDNLPLAFRWGVTRGEDDKLYCALGDFKYVPNKEFDKWIISSPAFFSRKSPETRPEEIEKPVEIDGLIFTSQDGGKKLEIRTNAPFSEVKTITLPLLTSYKWVEFAPINVEYKKR